MRKLNELKKQLDFVEEIKIRKQFGVLQKYSR